MEEYQEVQEGGISFKEIFKTIFSQKWLALILTVAITLVGVLGILFIYNPSKKVYEASFTIFLPGEKDGAPTTYTYPDGEIFRYTDIVSAENLNKIKGSNAAYSDIDVEKMTLDGKISITRAVNEIKTETATNGSSEFMYKITADVNCFKDEDVARSFISDLAMLPVEHLKVLKIDYDRYLTALKTADDLTYDTELNYLSSQTDYLLGWYSSLVTEYGENFSLKDGKTLGMYRSELEIYVSGGTGEYVANRIERLREEAREKGYVKSEDLKPLYEVQLSAMRLRYDREKAALDNLLNVSASSETIQGTIVVNGDKIVEQTNLVKTLEQQMADLENYQSRGTVNAEFEAKVKATADRLTDFTADFTAVTKDVYDKAATVSFYSPQIIVSVGGMGVAISVLLSFLIGLVIAFIAAYIVGKVKSSKVKPEENQSALAQVSSQAQAQAAAAEDETKKEN